MNELINRLFSTKEGKELYSNAVLAIDDYKMRDMICGGVLLGLSGGADSVALLFALLKFREEHDFFLKAVHINHCIRGDEANSDEIFSKELCSTLGIPFETFRIDVPKISKQTGKGLEEAARNARYEVFNSLISQDNRLSVIAVAHNATDNLETVIFNMLRGSGIAGVSGIKPVRDNIIRPLMYSSKELITRALEAADIEFVVDSTNKSSDYSRNYIRNEIIPKFSKISENPEKMCTRMSSNLRDDEKFLCEIADDFFKEKQRDGTFLKEDFLTLKKPVFSRVLMLMCKSHGLPMPEKIHIESIYNLIFGRDFSFSLSGGKSFVSSEGKVFIGEKTRKKEDFYYEIKEGVNNFPEFENLILLSRDECYDCFLNIYKKSIQVKFKFDIINNNLCIRSKSEGDSYRFDGMTRKLKKLFNDRKISLSERKDVPVFCDHEGILFVPGFKVRDGETDGNVWYITILEPIEKSEGKRYFRIANN